MRPVGDATPRGALLALPVLVVACIGGSDRAAHAAAERRPPDSAQVAGMMADSVLEHAFEGDTLVMVVRTVDGQTRASRWVTDSTGRTVDAVSGRVVFTAEQARRKQWLETLAMMREAWADDRLDATPSAGAPSRTPTRRSPL